MIDSKEVLANCPAPQWGRRQHAHTVFSVGGELLTSTEDIVGRWKEYFEELLNPTNTYSAVEGLGAGLSNLWGTSCRGGERPPRQWSPGGG